MFLMSIIKQEKIILTLNFKHMHNLTKTNLNQMQDKNLFNLILISNPFFLYRFKITIKEKKIEYIKINNFLEIDKSFEKLLKL